ncbi:amidase family protein, partial [bacterium]|nr:amidase family protein [bacterium]
MSKPTIQSISLDIASLKTGYGDNKFTPVDIVNEVYRRITLRGEDYVWTTLVDREAAIRRAESLLTEVPDSLPLYGIPFSVKDNIHVQGLPTTAGCPSFSHFPKQTAKVVTKLLSAGAILIGKNT